MLPYEACGVRGIRGRENAGTGVLMAGRYFKVLKCDSRLSRIWDNRDKTAVEPAGNTINKRVIGYLADPPGEPALSKR
ncbi:hypothetical protein E3T43_08580 [Cryobacterium sp. Hh7]|uniref:hypothetical protein n=1 Tax=Cryobacterium sp. Hh7 TaxID=1259159 RepID=UPI00106A8A9C|nr:hypothetical protein [Cryobacterium sp. Hh7]TFD56971.1 hypothetical protein E3T43_08580 [Cryobacterium sp. Hh7]